MGSGDAFVSAGRHGHALHCIQTTGLGLVWLSSGYSTKGGTVSGEEVLLYTEGGGTDGITLWRIRGWGDAVL